ncbi:alpha/beta hydrolase [Frondihabitans sp. 762G35]|uniref:alpha/beta hydrolase n=1 Tax=Frondihabitans sp. 762G35 TaxID=1446794 RepID=UPI001C1FE2A9|nr:alpha/beta hydrolase [Frondihabitans sp. 762G35]
MTDSERPAVFLLPGLGLSARAFDRLGDALGDTFDTVALDLPGFGDAPASSGTSVDDMVGHVIRAIRRHAPTHWILVGHSMGGKMATLVAARALAGERGVFGLAGVVLLAGSPPTPEPMDDDRRAEMISWAADGPLDAEAARTFVDGNVGAPLDAEADALVVADVRRSSPEAWTAWLERGSREDRSGDVGILPVPALIVAGGSDGDLGLEAQRSLNGPVYPRAEFLTLDGAGHLLMLERTDEVAEAIRRFWHDTAGTGPVVPADVARTMASGRTSSRTRGILAGRALADDPAYRPRVLDDVQLATLRAVADRTVPQPGESIDLAARLDTGLADGATDGWRNVALPTDVEAYRLALDALADFPSLDPDAQDARLAAVVDETFEPPTATLTAAQLALWFEDCRVDLVRLWLAHPATQALIGFDGFANGGDLVRIQGFLRLGADEKESWEPRMGSTR